MHKWIIGSGEFFQSAEEVFGERTQRYGWDRNLKRVEELPGVGSTESAMNIEILKIRTLLGHPFKAVDDEKMLREYFPKKQTTTEMRNMKENLLTDWKQRQEEEEVQIPDEVQLFLNP